MQRGEDEGKTGRIRGRGKYYNQDIILNEKRLFSVKKGETKKGKLRMLEANKVRKTCFYKIDILSNDV